MSIRREQATDGLLKIKKSEQYRTVRDLLERSQPTHVYNALLVLSSLIVSSGLLLGNIAVVIGGMLVTPILTPVLAIGLGLAIGGEEVIRKESLFVVKSFFIVILSSFVLSVSLGGSYESFLVNNSARVAILYFVIASSSGIAATLAWTRKEIAEILPGVAVAVSLVPPLSTIGIGLGSLDFEIIRASFFIFLLNFIGIVVGSLGVFSMLKFYKTGKFAEEKTKSMG
jgi:uncharacterized hydrophobic protein (TIGR00271 family)